MKKYLLIFLFLSLLLPGTAWALAPEDPGEDYCAIGLSFDPNVVDLGDWYSATISADNVQSGTLQFKCSDMAQWASLPDSYLNSTFDLQSDALGTKTCEVKARSATNQSCASSDTIATILPSCNASLSWNKESVPSGGSATETWNVSGADYVTGECTGTSVVGIGVSGSYTFNNITQDMTCTVRGYEYTNNVPEEVCSASDTVTLQAPPPPPPSPLKIVVDVVNASQEMSWKIVGPETYVGSGDEEILNVPAGTYTLYVTGGWNHKVVTSILPSQQQTLSVPTPPPPPGSPPPPPPPPPPPDPGPVVPDPDRPVPEPDILEIFFKSSPFKFLSGLIKSVSATEGTITFTINARMAKSNYGSVTVTPAEFGVNQTYRVEGRTNDDADAYKYIDLYKRLVRVSDGQVHNTVGYGWRGISLDENGNFDLSATFVCNGHDSSIFLDSDYEDNSTLLYDQGDGTGDSSPPVYMLKKCGYSFAIDSKNQNGNPISFPWSMTGLYGNWSDSHPKVSYDDGFYTMRLDRGLNTFMASPPPGYGSFKAELYHYAGGRGGNRQLLGTYYSTPIPIDLSSEGLRLIITWYSGGTGIPPGGDPPVCSPNVQEVEIGEEAILYGDGGNLSFAWSALEGNPSSGTGDSFTTTFNSIGTKTVTVTSNNKTDNCNVSVVPDIVNPPTPPTVDLKINGNNSWTMNSGGAVNLSWTSQDADSCVASGGSPGWAGSRPTSGNWNTGTLNAPPEFYNYSIRCFNSDGEDVDSATLNILPVGAPTLNVSLTATPITGASPLNASLRATVSGDATGPINYYFWWNCNSNSKTRAGVIADGCGDPSNSLIGQIVSNTNENPKTVTHPYVGVVGTTFTPKVVVERGAAASEQDKANVVISSDGETRLMCINNSCTKVPGGGINTCSPEGSSCVGNPETHLECINNSCVSVSGPGENDCSPQGSVCDDVDPPDPESACIFTSSPKIINRGGTSRLEWDCDPSVTSCSISQGIGPVSKNGTRNVSPAATTRYTLTCDTGEQNTSWMTTVNVFQIDEDAP